MQGMEAKAEVEAREAELSKVKGSLAEAEARAEALGTMSTRKGTMSTMSTTRTMEVLAEASAEVS